MHLLYLLFSSHVAAAVVAVDLTQTSLDPNFLTAASDLNVFIFSHNYTRRELKSGNSAIHTMIFLLFFWIARFNLTALYDHCELLTDIL